MASSPRHGAAATFGALPPKQGMYNPALEKDACGLAMVATLRGTAGHDIIDLALTALRNLEHRGAIGSDAGTGDGAGILTQMPDAFLRAVVGLRPAAGRASTPPAWSSCRSTTTARAAQKAGIERIAASENLVVLGWREVPTDDENLGKLAHDARPAFEQLFVSRPPSATPPPCRASPSTAAPSGCASAPDASSTPTSSRSRRRTLVYKGMVTTLQLEPFYPDLQDERFASKLAIVHSRYSTNTFPSWPLAQPLRMIAHNGEINTVNGNRNWMRARQSQLESELLGDIAPAAADLHARRQRLGLVRRGARAAHPDRPHPAARDHDDGARGVGEAGRTSTRSCATSTSSTPCRWSRGTAPPPSSSPTAPSSARRSTATACAPAAGPRPTDGLVVLASEIGVLDFAPERIKRSGPPAPRQHVPRRHRQPAASSRTTRSRPSSPTLEPWQEWLDAGRIHLADLPEREHIVHPPASVTRRQRTFGYTEEEVRILLTPDGRRPAPSRSAPWAPTPRSRCSASARACCSTTSRSSSRRSPTRRSTRSAKRSSRSLKLGLGPERNLLDVGPGARAPGRSSTSR